MTLTEMESLIYDAVENLVADIEDEGVIVSAKKAELIHTYLLDQLLPLAKD